MKKFFTFTLAILATMSMWAGVTVFTTVSQVTTDGSWTITGSNASGSEQSSVVFPDPAAEPGFPTGSQAKATYYCKLSGTSDMGAKLGANKCVTIKGLSKEEQITVYWFATNTTNTKLTLSYATDASHGAEIETIEQKPVVSKQVYSTTFSPLTEDNVNKITNGYSGSAGLAYISSSNSVYIYAIKLEKSCEAPAEALVLKASKTADVVAGDEITFSTEGGNGADVTIAGKDGETVTANKWTAVKGEHTFTATQDVKDGKCGNTVELKITVIANDPVTKAEITGPSKAKKGKEVTLTCVAEDATSFQWYKGGAKIDGATAETYKFTPDEAGELVFACEAWNKNNEEGKPAKSADFKVTVNEGDCGLLIKADLTGDKTAAVDPNSTVGGTTETNLGKAGKLDKKCFFGVTLADGEFAEGDFFIMNITTAADVDGSLKLYEDKAGSNLIVEIKEGIDGTGEKKWALPAAVAGKKSIYVYRANVTDWNAYFTSIAVKRSCGNESDDASLKYLTINGDTVKAKDNVYNYEIPESYEAADVKVKYELNDPGAKSSKELEFTIFAPDEAGDTIPAKFTVTAEDGTAIEYTVNVIRVKAASADATIKELKVNNTVVAEKEGVFAYEVPAEENLAKVKVEYVLNDPAAKATPASGFEIDVPAAGEAAKVETIVVEAQNGTKKEYKVSITKAKAADQGLEDILSTDNSVQKVLMNGQLFILKNGVLYNATGSVVK